MSYDALACIELSSIAKGMRLLDVIAKRAPVMLKHYGKHSGPKFIILFAGDVASVESSYKEALEESKGALISSMFLPIVSDKLLQLFEGKISAPKDDAILFVELPSVADAILQLDYSLKLIDADIVDAQFASGISGRGYYAIQGSLADMEYCAESLHLRLEADEKIAIEIVARPHEDLFAALGHHPVFSPHWT